jgi:hypothetical protein
VIYPRGLAYMWPVKPLLIACVLALVAGPAAADRSEKPSAPVTLRIDAKPIAGGYRLTLVAVATRAVPAVELKLAGKRIAFGATAAGETRTLVTEVSGDALDVLGSATAGGRNRVTSLRIGGVAQQQKTKRTVTRTLPDGRTVAESR